MRFSTKIKKEFSGKNILLLQGPVGNFFHHLAMKMKKTKPKFLNSILTAEIFFSILVERGVSVMKKILKISIGIFFKVKKSMLF